MGGDVAGRGRGVRRGLELPLGSGLVGLELEEPSAMGWVEHSRKRWKEKDVAGECGKVGERLYGVEQWVVRCWCVSSAADRTHNMVVGDAQLAAGIPELVGPVRIEPVEGGSAVRSMLAQGSLGNCRS